MQDNKKHILIVGGGITGLTAAFYLQKLIKQQNLPYQVTLAEKTGRLGGKIHTEEVDGFLIERGADSFLARKPAIIDLSRELGLTDKLVGTNPAARKNYILHRGKLHLMPPGLILGVPTQWGPFVRTGLISPVGKLRAALDLVIPPEKGSQDESLGSFLTRRLGREVAENIAEPLLSGIYAGDTEALSVNATFPQFKELERKYGSLIKGMMKTRPPRTGNSSANFSPLPEPAKDSVFLTYNTGLQTLVQSLVHHLSGVQIKMNQEIQNIIPLEGKYSVQLSNGEAYLADAIILSSPAYTARSLLADMKGIHLLGEIPYVSVANVVLAFDKKDIHHPLDASGFVVPRKETRHITACTWTSSKWPHTTPKDRVLLRCYVGHSRDESLVNLEDEELIQKVRDDIQEIMGITAKPLFHRITRLRESLPQYQVGHLERMDILRAQMRTLRPGILLAGAGYYGVGIPDCVAQGKQVSEQLVEYLKTREAIMSD